MQISFHYYPGGKRKALTLSYDDGRIEDRRLVELCNEYGMKATFHLNSGLLGKEGYVTKEEVPSLYQGHEVSVHTLTHPFLTQVPKERIIDEVRQDRVNLEQLADYPVKGMSYPFGAYNSEVIELLKNLGIVYSRTVRSTNSFFIPSDFMQWHPTCHHNQNLMDNFKRFLNSGKWDSMPLMYVWGHSYEFTSDNNWDLIEEFFKAAQGNDDIWFATNIEIYRYIQALNRLEFSMDCSMVGNPSAISVWIGVDGKAVEIPPAKTVKLL